MNFEISVWGRAAWCFTARTFDRAGKVIEMASPASRILARSVTAHFCPIEDDFNPSTHAARSFRLRVPDRLDHSHHMIAIYVLDRNRAKDRRHVSCQRVSPLLAMFSFFQLTSCALM